MMVPRTKEQFQQMRERTRERILDAALELFTYEGFGETTIEMIAKKASISKGLIYNYFDGKKDILRALLDKTFSGIRALFPMLEGIPDPYERLRLHIEESISAIQENEQFWRFHLQLMSQPATRPIIQDILVEFLGSVSNLLEGIFREIGVKNPAVEAMVLGVILDGMMIRYVLSDGMFPADLLKQRLIETYCKTG